MIFIDELYQKAVTDNEKNLKFWEDYLNSLESLNFNVYAEKLKVPVLVPIGNKIFFRGELKHTNEVTVSLGADYFVKCSIAQAEVLRQHRIKDAQSKADLYRKEKEHLENRISFTKENVYEKDGQEILEVYSEQEDKAWREKHRENVRKYKEGKAKEETKPKDKTPDDELWERLEELELQEELENELLDNYNEIVDKRKENIFLENQRTLLLNSFKEENNALNEQGVQRMQQGKKCDNNEVRTQKDVKSNENKVIEKASLDDSKHDLLQQVLDKQCELENKLHELRYREREQSKTEEDLIAKLDELEQLDELEDEIERLDDILKTEDEEINDSDEYTNNSEEDSNKSASTKLKKSISFADDDDSETQEINFTHSDAEPNKNPFNAEKGISKPSELYEAYSHLFDNKTTSILKKSKYVPGDEQEEKATMKKQKQVKFEEEDLEIPEQEKISVDRTIVIKDVVEKVAVNQHKIEGGARPTSLFKQRRMQQKS